MRWHIHVDGASSGNPGRSGAGIIVHDDFSNIILTRSIFLGEMTNNMAEYEALLRALRIAIKDSVKEVFVYTDSLLVANQINGTYKIKNAVLFQYVRNIQQIISNFEHFTIKYIPREENREADKLAKNAIMKG